MGVVNGVRTTARGSHAGQTIPDTIITMSLACAAQPHGPRPKLPGGRSGRENRAEHCQGDLSHPAGVWVKIQTDIATFVLTRMSFGSVCN